MAITHHVAQAPPRPGVVVYTVVGCDDRPIPGASIGSHQLSATRDTDTTFETIFESADAKGSLRLPATGLPRRVRLTIAGKTIDARVEGRRIVACDIATVASVTVATGSARTLHDLPVAASALDRATIARAPVLTTDALLRELPGFDAVRSNSAFTNYGQLRLSLDGSGNDRGAILVDGVPGQDGFGGQVDWSAYAPGEITSAELLRGPGSALYGSGAIGGTLALATFGPPAKGAPSTGEFAYELGTRETRDLTARYGANLGGNLSASASLDERHEAYLDIPPSQGAPIDTAAISTESTTHLKLRYDAGATAIAFGTIQAYDDQEEGRPNYRFGRTFGQYDASVDTPAGAGSLHLGAYARDASIVNVADQLPAKPGILRYVQNVPTYENGLAARYVGPSTPLQVDVLADLRDVRGESRQTGTTGLVQNDNLGEQRYLGAGVQVSYRRPRFEVLGGVRGDDIALSNESTLAISTKGVATRTAPPARTNGAISPRVAARYDLTPSVALRASAGDAFREPYLNELIRSYQIGSVVYASNPDLEPERSGAIGAGVDMSVPGGRLAVDATRSYVNDAILFVTSGATLERRENVGATRTDGVTAEYRAAVAKCVDVRLFGTAQHARVLAGPAPDVGKELAFVPTAIAGAGTGVRTGSSSLDVDVAYAGPAYADDLQKSPLGTAVVTSLRLSTNVSGATISIFADNASDARYLSSIDRYAPPSTLGLRVALPVGTRPDPAAAHCSP